MGSLVQAFPGHPRSPPASGGAQRGGAQAVLCFCGGFGLKSQGKSNMIYNEEGKSHSLLTGWGWGRGMAVGGGILPTRTHKQTPTSSGRPASWALAPAPSSAPEVWVFQCKPLSGAVGLPCVRSSTCSSYWGGRFRAALGLAGSEITLGPFHAAGFPSLSR